MTEDLPKLEGCKFSPKVISLAHLSMSLLCQIQMRSIRSNVKFMQEVGD